MDFGVIRARYRRYARSEKQAGGGNGNRRAGEGLQLPGRLHTSSSNVE
jgi:hypothetical protein